MSATDECQCSAHAVSSKRTEGPVVLSALLLMTEQNPVGQGGHREIAGGAGALAWGLGQGAPQPPLGQVGEGNSEL